MPCGPYTIFERVFVDVCFVCSSFKLANNKVQGLCGACETFDTWQGTKCTSGIPVSIVFHTLTVISVHNSR